MGVALGYIKTFEKNYITAAGLQKTEFWGMTFQHFHEVTFSVPHFFPKLSESVVNRMKDSSQPSGGQQLASGLGPAPPAPVPTIPVLPVPTPTTPVPTTPEPTAPSSSASDTPEGTFKAPQTGMLGEWE